MNFPLFILFFPHGNKNLISLICSHNERNNGMIIQYDDMDGLGLEDDQGVTRFDLSEDTAAAAPAGDLNSLKSSLVDLDLNLLPLDAKTLPEEAIRTHNVHRRHQRNNRYNTDTIRSTHSAKSVKIANNVTEYHYSGIIFHILISESCTIM